MTTESGIDMSNYGDYLASIIKQGYSTTEGVLTPEMEETLQTFIDMPPTVATPVLNKPVVFTPEQLTPSGTMETLPEFELMGDQGDGFDIEDALAWAIGGLSALGVTLPGPILTIIGSLGIAYTGAQALGLGEGEGLLGNDLLGGNGDMSMQYPVIPGTDIVLQGPGAAEPYPKYIVKEWAGIGGSRFYLLINGRVAVRKRNGVWKMIRRPAMLHMKLTNPRMGDIVKADRAIQKVVKVIKKRLPSARKK